MSISMQFLGATQEVTGSCHLLQVNNQQVLLDCGLIQGGGTAELRNRDPFIFQAGDIDMVVLSHAHIDHSGRLPLLVKSGFTGPIYTHKATAELCNIMLRDAAMLQLRDTERLNKKLKKQDLKPVEPLFNEEDVDAAMKLFVMLDYGESVPLSPQIRVRLSDAGHILGSAIVELWLDDDTHKKKLVFSGDLGRPNMPILDDPTMIEHADLVVMEGTYGDRLHRGWEETLAELKDIFSRAISQGTGNILIPAFSVGRAQELLYLFHLYEKDWDLDRWTICLDSPMAIAATEVFVNNYGLCDDDFKAYSRQHPGKHPLLSNIQFIQDTEESMALNEVDKGLIIIAGSGMCNGGRIRCHFEHNLWRPECHVIICGFQALGTPGRLLVDGATELTVFGKSIKVAAQISTIGGLSAHADQAELSNWYQHFDDAPPLVLVHGEPDALNELQADLQPSCSAVTQARFGDSLDLTQLPALKWQYLGSEGS
jgi:metallo-beta-lactamase family protein